MVPARRRLHPSALRLRWALLPPPPLRVPPACMSAHRLRHTAPVLAAALPSTGTAGAQAASGSFEEEVETPNHAANSSPAQAEQRHLAPAGFFTRGFAFCIDSVVCTGVAGCVAEHAIAHHGSGLEVFLASYAGLMCLRDQLPGRYPSIGKQRMGLELVQVAPGGELGEVHPSGTPRPFDRLVVHGATRRPIDEPLSRAQRLGRNAHWALLAPLALMDVVPAYYTFPMLFGGGLCVIPRAFLGLWCRLYSGGVGVTGGCFAPPPPRHVCGHHSHTRSRRWHTRHAACWRACSA